MLKILPYSYDEDIKPISSGNTNEDIYLGGGGEEGGSLKCFGKGRGVYEIDVKEVRITKKSKKTLNKWVRFLFWQRPHLVNLNEDPLMSECLLYYIKDGITR